MSPMGRRMSSTQRPVSGSLTEPVPGFSVPDGQRSAPAALISGSTESCVYRQVP